MPHTTIRDVAREADVSIASVSRVLNGRDNVAPGLRARVEEVAGRLGYVPHAGARNLSLSRTGTIGIVLPDLHGEFYSELLRGMDEEAARLGFHLLLTVMHSRSGRGPEALAALRGQVDGLIVMAPQIAPERLAGRLPANVPALLLYSDAAADRPAITLDNRSGATAMVEHLAARSCRRLLFVAGPPGNRDARERRAGVEQAAARLGLHLDVAPGDFSEAAGTAAAHHWLSTDPRADAIFAANDMMAIGVMMALKRAGISVPDQVAVGGFDDIPLARLVSPALTTVGADIALVGARAVQRIAARVAGTDTDAVETVLPRLTVRESTQPRSAEGDHWGTQP